MLPRCRQAVDEAAKAAGRPIPTAKQYEAIESQIKAAMARLAQTDPEWQGLTSGERLRAGAAAVMEEIKALADRKLANAERQIVIESQVGEEIGALRDAFKDTPGHDGSRAEAQKRHYANTDIQIAAERKFNMGRLTSLIEAAADKLGAGMGRRVLMNVFDAENPVMTRDIVREIFKNADGHTGNDAAKIAARAWLDTIEQMRVRFNAAGGDVGRLVYGYVPQPHDIARIRKVTADVWAQKVMPLLDRSRYVLEDGSRMSDAELTMFLRNAHETLATDGLSKQEPGAFHGSGKRANRGGDERQIHFADGEAWSAYMSEFGSGSIYDAMLGHVHGMTRDTVLIERYGPDANATARLQNDLTARVDGTSAQRLVGTMSIDPKTYWDMISGKTGAPVDESLANNAQMVRNIQVADKLGAAVVSSVTDLGTMTITSGYNQLPFWQLVKDVASQGTKETREWMSVQGMISESAANAINRWSGDNLGSNWSGKLANSVLKASFLTAWTNGLRQGFTMSMNARLASMAKKTWAELDEFDRVRFRRSEITEADWTAMNSIAPTHFKGRELLTPQSILASGHPQAQSIAAKVFGFIHDESEFAVVNPNLATRAVQTWGGLEAGTKAGELARTTMQFKSFPIAMMTRHWARMLEGNLGTSDAPMLANRTAYAFALAATLTGLGAIAVQEKQILAGKDPIDMSKGRFWIKALTQGGGFSIFGDLFLVDPSGSPGDAMGTLAKNILGPTFGSVGELFTKNVENVWQEAAGKDSHWQVELFKWAKAQTPAANLWWLKPLVEHGFTNAMNESMSPGYLARQQQRAAKEWGQRWWWAPKDKVPQRAPDLTAAVP
jgi:hypothetical protein